MLYSGEGTPYFWGRWQEEKGDDQGEKQSPPLSLTCLFLPAAVHPTRVIVYVDWRRTP